jgi:hypothetical protein
MDFKNWVIKEREEKYKTYWYGNQEGYYYIYKNPNKEELLHTIQKDEEIKKAKKYPPSDDSVRGFLTNSGDIYIWPASTADIHDEVAAELKVTYQSPFYMSQNFHIKAHYGLGALESNKNFKIMMRGTKASFSGNRGTGLGWGAALMSLKKKIMPGTSASLPYESTIIESSLVDLYDSAVKAFPSTTKRQHATNPIKIVELTWVPYKGMKTLFVRGLARNEDRTYNPIIVFKNVQYLKLGGVQLIDNNGQQHFLERLSLEENDVLVRCGCKDFGFRFNYYNHLDKSLQGTKRTKYESKGVGPPANPQEIPGMCKHLMKMMIVLHNSGIIK